ncbi:Bacilysin biosynthesis oxidoreductase BacC [Pleurostoma richardsiae]|uniref:Bacilysin biosynthesis oxidoreductase BacC n=1 Tax=Pleurostoma richardsiae TaxID=41990 RepID=A0AA38VN39_9PEZI|nr:Bacilysin biosynthesis oxidoreductase BacC [Pleurostoma richardsiae]
MADQKKYADKLKGDRVLVIGGTSGIGYGVTEACIESGCAVIVSGSSQASADRALQKLRDAYPSAKDRISASSCSFGDETTIEQNIASLFREVSASGTVDHIVFTAGDAILPTPLAEFSVDKIKRAGLVRFYAPLLVAKYATPHLTAGPKSSFTLTSGAALYRPHPGWALTGGYLAGLQGVMRSLALEMRPVRVNLIVPGLVDTEMWNMDEETKQMIFEAMRAKTMTGVVGRVEDVAQSYLGVMKDWNCTGSVVDTHSGQLLM